MKRLMVFIVASILGCVDISYGFEIDGFKDGMRKDVVLEKSLSWNYDKVDDRGDSVGVYDFPDKKTYRHINLSFHNNRLVGFQKNYKPSMANYIMLFKELGDKYGDNVNCSAGTDLSTSGENKNITCIWVVGNEKIHISYNIFPSNDQLSVYYNAYDKYNNTKTK
ncbi:MAG: hypothetical protein L6246_01090 [Thermodesulfovibrionales bacterium]|nr:hypothetical protein [Nitrospinota bacterium]MCG2708908.1 hypothetical protein [Thermodesulfovibrionales bacterium]